MEPPAPDRSRDRRIEDPTNLFVIHPAARSLLPWFVSHGISANAVSVSGLSLGALAALAYANWISWPFSCIGLLLSVGWLVADGLDGMIARETGTASPLGRFLDGICDHVVFLLIYVAVAASLGTLQAWILSGCAGAVHALQSNLYESERARFHRRCIGIATAAPARGRNAVLRIYDHVPALVDSFANRFDEVLGRGADQVQLGAVYGANAATPLRFMSILSANVRVYAIFVACLAGDPRLFWWFELGPLTMVLVIGLCWHRAVESRLVRSLHSAPGLFAFSPLTQSKDLTD
jgi:CDP-diacylglycerol--serine O-phosphatidyltransferase